MSQMRDSKRNVALLLFAALLGACGSSAIPATEPTETIETNDPGTGPWNLVDPERVDEECGLDLEILRGVDESLDRAWAVVRYGKLCHEFYPEGTGDPVPLYSATKTMAAAVLGIVAYETRNFERTGRKTGPVSDEDRVDHWLDEFSFNPDAQLAHLMGMVAFNEDLSWGAKTHVYDANGSREINRLSDIANTALAQDPERFGANLEEFTQKFLFEKLGMRDSVWSGGRPDKSFASQWSGTIQDMARVGWLINQRGAWNGERLLDEEWIYRMTHPSFEDSNTSYGYLTWLASNSNYDFGGIIGLPEQFQVPLDPCSPPAINRTFPHGISAATDCNYSPPWRCEQEFDVGVWYASGAGGQLIVGHPGLDMVLVMQNFGSAAFHGTLSAPVMQALIALDPKYRGDREAFCADYSAGRYAPDLR